MTPFVPVEPLKRGEFAGRALKTDGAGRMKSGNIILELEKTWSIRAS
jgi:hypothetical protein